MLKGLVLKNRSYRRFDQSIKVDKNDLVDLIELARNCPSGRNLQTLKYYISNNLEINSKIFTTLSWAGYLKDWDGPVEGERPSAYIIILEDLSIGKNIILDQGIVAQTMLLGAVEKGLGGCMIYTINRKELATIIELPDNYEICLVLALGLPIEKVILESIPQNGCIKYWRDSNQIHHVPKRDISDLIISK